MSVSFRYAVTILVSAAVAACGNNAVTPPPSVEATQVPTTTPPVTPAPSPAQAEATITPKGFRGILVGSGLDQYERRLRAGMLVDGEGSFGIYYIDGDADTAPAILHPQPSAEGQIVFLITVTKPGYSTPEGIGVGSTWADLQAAYPGIEAHGSEIESRVYAQGGAYSFKLDANSVQHDLPRGVVTAGTRVTEINVRH